jgi:hypothetical protein
LRDLKPSNVSNQVRVLADCHAITLVGTRPARGSVQHCYRSTVKAPWALRVLGLAERSNRGGAGESSDDAPT